MIFKITRKVYAKCETYETRYSWGHKAWLYKDGCEIGYKKITYYNRTWEAYQFQTILECLTDNKQLTTYEARQFTSKIKNNWVKEDAKRVSKQFGMIANIARMGELLTDSQEKANDWKARMLQAGLPGLEIPADWNTLSEADKQVRLDGVIKQLRG